MDSAHSAFEKQRTLKVEAVVLKHLDWGEADRLVTLFTLELGKLRVVAKGARRLRSRKAGHLEPFTRVSLLLGRGRDLPIISQADTLQAFTSLRDDLKLATYASYAVELLDRFTYEEGEQRGLYHLLVDTLERLDSPVEPELATRYYEIHLLDLLGFRPRLFRCARCQAEIQAQDQYFSYELGGVLCPNCGRQAGNINPISMTALKYLRHFQRSNFNEARRAHPNSMAASEMEAFMQGYLTYLLERGLNSPAFLRRVRGS